MNESYQLLARDYDRFQQDIDYPAWAAFIARMDQQLSGRNHPGDGRDGRPLVLDLGCGTGSIALELERLGYDAIGIDQSTAMLEQARDKALAAGSAALFLHQDISRFELFGTVDLAVCLLDTLNHLIRPAAVLRLFNLLANYLNPGSLFIADVGSRRHFTQTLGNRLFYEDHDEVTLFWKNSFRPQSGMSRSRLTWFSRGIDGRYERFDEEIAERYYDHTFLLQAARKAGLEYIGRTGELTDSPPTAVSERIFYLFRRRTNL